MVPSARSGEPATPGISGGVPGRLGPAHRGHRPRRRGQSEAPRAKRCGPADGDGRGPVSLGPRSPRSPGSSTAGPSPTGRSKSRDCGVHYEDYGTGPNVLVFMHGILLDSQMNRRLASDLAASGNRVILLDLPGHGQSDKPRHASAHRIDSYAHYVVALLDDLGIDEAVIGGRLARGQRLAAGGGPGPRAGPGPSDRDAGARVGRPRRRPRLSPHAPRRPLRGAAGPGRGLAGPAAAPDEDRALDSFVATLTLDPEETTAVLHGMLAGPITPTYEERHAIAAPTLVIGHKIDFIHPFTDADHLTRQLPLARLVEARSIIELRVAPERLTTHIAGFLDEVWGHAPFQVDGPAAGPCRPRPEASGARVFGPSSRQRGPGRGPGVGVLGELGHRPGQAALDDVVEVHPVEDACGGWRGRRSRRLGGARPGRRSGPPRDAVRGPRPGGRRGRA